MASDIPSVYDARRVSLRPVCREDFLTLYQWRAEMEALRLSIAPPGTSSYEEFARWMDSLLQQTITLLAVSRQDGQAAGFVQASGINEADGWCYIAAYFAPDYRRQNYGSEACIAFFDYLFRTLNLRKIYMEVSEFNSGFLSNALEFGLVEEGRFRQHAWHDNRYWDMILLAVYKEAWPELRKRARLVLDAGDEGS